MKKFLLHFFFPLILLLLPNLTFAKTAQEYDEEISQLEKKISEAQSSVKTLSSQISYYDDQITLANIKIAQSEEQSESYTQKISALEDKLSYREKLLLKQISQGYIEGRTQPLFGLFQTGGLSQLFSKLSYNRQLQIQNRQLLYDTQFIQTTYKQQKILIEASRQKISQQKVLLDNLKRQKNQLLVQTKNNEVTYQKLLAEAVSQREALKGAAANFGGSHILPAQPSPDGWFYNQRDERWGNICIGVTCSYKNPSYVWELGCLITSVAMLQKKNGANVTPANFAVNSSYFFEDLLLIPWPTQSGFKFTRYSQNLSLLDSELAAGRPVVAELKLTGNSEHFVVIKSKNGTGYVMNDPWFGPDLTFSDHYSLSNIISLSTYTRT